MRIARFVSFLSTILFIVLTLFLFVYYNLDKTFLKSFVSVFNKLKEINVFYDIFKLIDKMILNYGNTFKYGSLIFGLFHIVLSSSAFSTFKRNDVPKEYMAFGILNILTLNLILGAVSLMSVSKARKNKKQKEEPSEDDLKKIAIRGIMAANGKNPDECSFFDGKSLTPLNQKKYNLPVLPKHNNKAFIWLFLLLGVAVFVFFLYGAYAIFAVLVALVVFYNLYCGQSFYKKTLNKAQKILNRTNASIDEVRHMMKNINIVNEGYDRGGRYLIIYSNNKAGTKKDFEGLTCSFVDGRLVDAQRSYRRTTYYQH